MSNLINSTTDSPTVAEIDLNAFRKNINSLRKSLVNVMLLAVVKSNAYGHGILEISKAAVKYGVDRLGITSVEEGVLLRKNGVEVPIQLLSSVPIEQVANIVKYNLTASVSTENLAHILSKESIKQNRSVYVHLKIDTGLHRFGIQTEDAIDFCNTCYNLPGLVWEGIYTHFSSADEGDWETTNTQFSLYLNTVAKLKTNNYTFPIHHVGGSTIAIERPDMHLDMVRPGIALFGYRPAKRQKEMIDLNPVMKLTSKIVHVRRLPMKTHVGYGGTYITKSNEKLAVLPIGHGDGYKRALSNIGSVLVKGKRAKIIGMISLDQMIIDVTNITDVSEGEEVVLIGRFGDDEITGAEIANWLDSIVDEVLSSLMEHIPRKYIVE